MTESTRLPHLLSPFILKDLPLKNRVVMAPMTRARASQDRIPNALMQEYYGQRSGAGLIITEGTTISPQANGWDRTPGIYTLAQVEAWKPIVQEVHRAGVPIFLQLWHTGRASHSSFHENNQLPIAPSPIKIEGFEAHTPDGKKSFETPRELKTQEVMQVVEQYRLAALNAKDAGFDGVEIHGANGYLIDQFLQSKTNHRRDRYGGSRQNRFTFLKEVIEAILTVWEPSRVGLRLSPNGVYNDMGSPDYRETFTYVIERLNQYQLCYLHVLDGLDFGFHQLGEPMTLAEIRQIYQGVLMGNCGYDRDSAEAAIASGHADLIAFGRPFISNPDLVERFTHQWSLSPAADPSVWYSKGSQGYTDFPPYSQSPKAS